MNKRNILPIILLLCILIIPNVSALSLNDGLVSYWKFDVSGVDSINKYNLTSTGSATVGLPGKINNGYNNSNGSNTRYWGTTGITAGNWWSGAVNNTQCFWINSTSFTNSNMYFLGTNGVRQLISPQFTSSNAITYNMNGENPTISLSTSLSLNKWYFICMNYDAGLKNISVYINGTFVGSQTHATAQAFTPNLAYVGSGNTLGVGFFGSIDEFGVWNRSLSILEMQTLYNSDNGNTYPFFNNYILSIGVNNVVNGSTISSFCINATGTNTSQDICTTNGTVSFNTTGIYNITAYNISNNTYFNQTQLNYNFNSTNSLIFNTYQGLLNVTVTKLYLNTSISNFSVNNSLLQNSTTIGWLLIPSNNDNNNVRVDVAGNYSLNHSCTGISLSTNPCLIDGVYDSKINVSAQLFNGTSISNFTIYGYNDSTTTLLFSNSTTTGWVLFNIQQGLPINYLLNNSLYAYANVTKTVTNNSDGYRFTIYTTNSVNFTVYDGTTNVILSSTNVSVQLVGTFQQYNFSITTGTKYVDLLAPDTYNALFSANGYFTKNYLITVSPNQYQYINAYLLNNTNTNNKLINFLITDTSALPLEGVLVQVQRLLNTTYSTIESRYTDISGQVQFSLDTTLFYRVIESKNGYITKVYQIQPISTSYTDRMSDTNTITNTNLYSNVTYYTIPIDYNITPVPLSQNFQLITAGTGIISYGISDGITAQNFTTGSGGTAQITHSFTSNTTQTVRIYYYINSLDEGLYQFSKDYVFSNVIENGNYTIGTSSGTTGITQGGKTILGALITIAVLIGLGAFMSGAVLTVVTIGLIIFLVATGFYPMWIGVVFGVLLSLTLYIKER